MSTLSRCVYVNNLQVATAGEDEEDLWVVDGQQRTARRDDEHGCASNTTGTALLLFDQISRKEKEKQEEIQYILLSEVHEENSEMSALLSAVGRNYLQLAQPWRAAAAPSSAVHVLEVTGCISRPNCAVPPGLMEDRVGKTEKREHSRVSGCQIRLAYVSKKVALK